MIAVRFTDWADLRVGQLGILTPDTDDEWQSEVDCVLRRASALPLTANG